MENKKTEIKFSGLPLVLAIVTIASLSALGIIWFTKVHFQNDAIAKSDSIQKGIQAKFDSEVKMLNSIADTISEDPQILAAWQNKNRDKLFQTTHQYYSLFKKNFDITHFYFHNLDKTNFLRVHKPEQFGDLVTRQSLETACKTNCPSHEMELGKNGNVALRLVKPWIVDNNTIGFIEIGKELDKVFSEIASQYGIGLTVLGNSSVFDDMGSNWIHQKNIETYNCFFVIYSSLKTMPEEVKKILLKASMQDCTNQNMTYASEEKKFSITAMPLLNSEQNQNGIIFIHNDITEHTALLENMEFIVFAFVIFLCLIISYMIHGLNKDKEQKLNKIYNDLHTEIDTRKSIEEYLSKQSLFLQNLIDTIPAPVFYKDKNGKYIGCNKAFEKFYAAKRENLIGKTVFDVAPKELAEAYYKQDIDLLQNPGVQSYECTARTFNGEVKNVMYYKGTFTDTHGNIDGIIGVMLDVTGQKFAEKSLAESELGYKNLFESAVDSMLVITPDGTIIDCNSASCSAFGYTKEKLINTGLTAIICQEHLEHLEHAINIIDTQNNYFYESICIKRDGEGFAVEIQFAKTMYKNKPAITVAIRDISERKLDEEVIKEALVRLEQNNKELKEMQSQIIQNEKLASIGQLAAGVAHEMNTPIGFVSSNFETLMKYLGKIRKVLSQYETIKNKLSQNIVYQEDITALEALKKELKFDFIISDIDGLFGDSIEGLHRVTTIVQNLRDFSRVDQSEEFGEHNLNKSVESTLIVGRNEVKYDIDVTMQIDEAMPNIFCNSGQINQVLLNIIVNASQAIKGMNRPHNGKINVKTCHDQQYVICEITDDGPGIPKSLYEKIFEPFFTTKEPGKGTGLGLAVSYDIIVNKHKGKLLIDSKVGEYTKFTIMLPIDSPIKKQKKAAPAETTLSPF